MAFRGSRRLLLGQYSRMLDMGGAPHASTTKAKSRAIDGHKNSKLQAIAFDFNLLTTAVGEQANTIITDSSKPSCSSREETSLQSATVDLVQNMASLLKVDLGGILNKKKPGTTEIETEIERTPNVNANTSGTNSSDVRMKYASKLRNKVQGGVAGYERAKHEHSENLKRGDASGHLVARSIASQQSASKQKWLASTGTGTLLSYVSNRSMKVALLPIPNNPQQVDEGKQMGDFCKQLGSQVHFDVLVKEGRQVKNVLESVMAQFGDVPNDATMVVSNRDDYLQAAKNLGLLTCRVQPLNSRRGNITAHYNVKNVPEVQEVVNEINGISFNAVSKAR